MFQAFAARMFEQRVLSAYREQIAEERRLRLLQELEEETRQEQLREERKEREKEKKREKKRYVRREPFREHLFSAQRLTHPPTMSPLDSSDNWSICCGTQFISVVTKQRKDGLKDISTPHACMLYCSHIFLSFKMK